MMEIIIFLALCESRAENQKEINMVLKNDVLRGRSKEIIFDNNAAENALRRIAVGRNNWTFLGSDHGGNTAAVLFSLIATCDRHKVDPFAYLRDVLTRLAAHPSHRLAELLPVNWHN